MPELHPIVESLDEQIREIAELQFAVNWKRPFSGLPDLGWIIEMAAYDVSVNVVFFGGADFDPPPPLGDTDRSRYVKVRSVEEANRAEMARWIGQAARVPDGSNPGPDWLDGAGRGVREGARRVALFTGSTQPRSTAALAAVTPRRPQGDSDQAPPSAPRRRDGPRMRGAGRYG